MAAGPAGLSRFTLRYMGGTTPSVEGAGHATVPDPEVQASDPWEKIRATCGRFESRSWLYRAGVEARERPSNEGGCLEAKPRLERAEGEASQVAVRPQKGPSELRSSAPI